MILHTLKENPSYSGSDIARVLKLCPQTVNRVIKRFNESLTIERAPGSGKKPGPVDKILSQKVIRSIKSNPGLSLRDQAKKFKTSKSNIANIRSRHGLKSFQAIKQPNRTDKQNLVAKQRARLLYDKFLTKFEGCILMDDETYVKMDFKQLPGQKFYASQFRGNVPKKFKYVLQDKFAKKAMIWQAICSCGIKSRTFVTSETMKAPLYIKECLQNRVLPLIRSHHSPVMFWPDLASIHYARATMDWFEANQVDVMPKSMNPPNCPKLRPIEEFWAIVKRKLKKNGGTAADTKQLREKWNKSASEVSVDDVQRLMGTIKGRVRQFCRSVE